MNAPYIIRLIRKADVLAYDHLVENHGDIVKARLEGTLTSYIYPLSCTLPPLVYPPPSRISSPSHISTLLSYIYPPLIYPPPSRISTPSHISTPFSYVYPT